MTYDSNAINCADSRMVLSLSVPGFALKEGSETAYACGIANAMIWCDMAQSATHIVKTVYVLCVCECCKMIFVLRALDLTCACAACKLIAIIW